MTCSVALRITYLRSISLISSGAVPAYLLDRENVTRAKILSNTVKQKRKEKAGKWTVPIPKVRGCGGCVGQVLKRVEVISSAPLG